MTKKSHETQFCGNLYDFNLVVSVTRATKVGIFPTFIFLVHRQFPSFMFFFHLFCSYILILCKNTTV
jgi:hypothetical protein